MDGNRLSIVEKEKDLECSAIASLFSRFFALDRFVAIRYFIPEKISDVPSPDPEISKNRRYSGDYIVAMATISRHGD